MNNYCVVTTINKPTKAIEVLHEKFGGNLIVVGDKKTIGEWIYKDAKYINPFIKPFDSYARKNFGYLEAMRLGAELIYDTDDDNTPNENWQIRNINTEAQRSCDKDGWVNVYRIFKDCYVWCRGFSLKHIHGAICLNNKTEVTSSIQQGMADNEADVDAIWRLVVKKQIFFDKPRSVYLSKGSWCPFNSQSTWFFKKAFPLMYLPVYSTFRMTDIWRSFVAQRCLWEIGEGVTFHSPSEVYQDRNEHDLLKDFEDEIPGYLHNDEIVEILSSLKLKQGEENMCDNLLTCYHALVNKNILPLEEIHSVNGWIKKYEEIAANMG